MGDGHVLEQTKVVSRVCAWANRVIINTILCWGNARKRAHDTRRDVKNVITIKTESHPSRAFLDLSEVSGVSEKISSIFCAFKVVFIIFSSQSSTIKPHKLLLMDSAEFRSVFSNISLCCSSFQVWVGLSEDLASRIFQLCTKTKAQITQFFYSSNGHSLTTFFAPDCSRGKS